MDKSNILSFGKDFSLLQNSPIFLAFQKMIVFENIAGKGENAGYHILVVPAMWKKISFEDIVGKGEGADKKHFLLPFCNAFIVFKTNLTIELQFIFL